MEDNNKLIIPGAIIIAGALIAGALYFGNGANQQARIGDALPQNQEITEIDFSEEYIFGNPDAKIKVVEYADTNCRFCKAFHSTMKQVMSEYGNDGQVAWVYRHFSILGPNSIREAQAVECAGELGGNEKYWEYLDHLFTEAKNEGAQLLPGQSIETVASAVGLNPEELVSCVDSGKYAPKIQEHTQAAQASGGRGTPFSLAVDEEGNTAIINGAQPYENVKMIIESALAN